LKNVPLRICNRVGLLYFINFLSSKFLENLARDAQKSLWASFPIKPRESLHEIVWKKFLVVVVPLEGELPLLVLVHFSLEADPFFEVDLDRDIAAFSPLGQG